MYFLNSSHPSQVTHQCHYLSLSQFAVLYLDWVFAWGHPYGGHGIMKQGVFKVYPVSSPQAPCSKFPLTLAQVLQPGLWLSQRIIATRKLRLLSGVQAFQHQMQENNMFTISGRSFTWKLQPINIIPRIRLASQQGDIISEGTMEGDVVAETQGEGDFKARWVCLGKSRQSQITLDQIQGQSDGQ